MQESDNEYASIMEEEKTKLFDKIGLKPIFLKDVSCSLSNEKILLEKKTLKVYNKFMPDSSESHSKFTPEELSAVEKEIPAFKRLPKIRALADLAQKMDDPSMRGGMYSSLDPINQHKLEGLGVPNRPMTREDIAGHMQDRVLEADQISRVKKDIQTDKHRHEVKSAFPKKPSVWEKRTTITDRSFNQYCELLGISESDLKGKSVLDLGSGKKQRFAKEAMRKGITVLSVSPDLSDQHYRDLLKPGIIERVINKITGVKNDSLVAIAQELPFRDESFDVITSIVAVPDYLPADNREIRNAFLEMIRVLKPGGKAYLCSYSPPDHARTKLIDQNLLKLQNSGIQVSKQLTDDRKGGVYNKIVLSKP